MIAQPTAETQDRVDLIFGDLDVTGGEDRSQYVSFTVAGCYYGIEITRVREIKGWSEPTTLPNSPNAMRGVLNLRGVVVPVFDLRCRFGRGNTDVTESHVVIIVSLEDRLIGILVDAVSDILTLGTKDIMPVPRTETDLNQDFLTGLVSQGERMVTLLKLDSLFEIDG
jgi:purine-binding chemotaxis protein CheW